MKKIIPTFVASLLIVSPVALYAQDSRPTSSPTSQPISQPISQPAVVSAADFAEDFADAIEDAHGGDEWDQQEAIEAEVHLTFGGNEVLNGTILFKTDTSGVRIESNGTTMVWDGSRAWATPADAATPRVRFHVLTWPYFLAAPFKLNDPGANLADNGIQELEGDEYDTARLTFGDGVGDAPDDWYIVYKDQGGGALKALAYIVTYGKSTEEAEAEPHAVVYHDFEEVEGVVIPHTWRFYDWSAEQGVFGEPLGKMEIKSIDFVDADDDDFAKPEGAAEASLPGAE